MKEVTISARIPVDLNDNLTRLALALRRNRSWVIEEAIRGYIASEQEFLDAVEEGIQDMRAGNVVPHDVAMKEVDALLAPHPASEK